VSIVAERARSGLAWNNGRFMRSARASVFCDSGGILRTLQCKGKIADLSQQIIDAACGVRTSILATVFKGSISDC
jgi:hypothetical protein